MHTPSKIVNHRIGLSLTKPSAAIAALAGPSYQADLLGEYCDGIRELGMSNVAPDRFKAAAETFEKAVGILLDWAKNPRVKSEIFMFRKCATGEKFSHLVAFSTEEIILIVNYIFEFLSASRSLPITHKRAQIMSIRGLALSCAPNFTSSSDVKSFSRSSWGIA